MIPDNRMKKVALVAHCHLNVNTKIFGYATYPSAQKPLIAQLLENDIGIIQLPCPEIVHAGMKRWGCCYEQYDTEAYRKTCRDLLGPIIATLTELTKDGVSCVGVYGVDGSPSCGINKTCTGYLGGDIEASTEDSHGLPIAKEVAGSGVFIEELKELLITAHIACEYFGIQERVQDVPDDLCANTGNKEEL